VKEPWRKKARCNPKILFVGLAFFFCACFSSRANVYATDIRVNGSAQAGVVVPGSPVTISFILNDVATNVSVQIYAGTNVVKTFAAGTNTGLNTIVWNGTNDDGSAAAAGAYNISITAAAAGYDEWTNITDDGTNFDVFFPTGIAVNKNTNSPYYGRVFIGNSMDGGGQTNGIFKFNADGSPGDEGGFSTGGYSWNGGNYASPSPWKMDIGADDRLYVENWSDFSGVVESFDELLSTNYLDVLRADNYPYSLIQLSGPCVRGDGTNMRIFMADIDTTNAIEPGLGVLSWAINSNGIVATNDIGAVEVTLTNNSDMTLAPYAVSLDTNGDIYAIQRVQDDNDSNPRLLCFPPPPNGGPPDTTSIWEVGSGSSTMVDAYGVAVDPTCTFVAVASRGYGNDVENFEGGGISIFLTANASLVTNLNDDPEGFTNQECIDVAWDNVGNLYITYQENSFSQAGWRVYSPPGSNQSTTIAIPVIQVYQALTPPQLSQPIANLEQLSFTLAGQSNVTYVVQQSPDLVNWTPVATNFSPTAISSVSVTPPDTQDFYRAVASP
jgi:FlgD Ig-like domain